MSTDEQGLPLDQKKEISSISSWDIGFGRLSLFLIKLVFAAIPTFLVVLILYLLVNGIAEAIASRWNL